MEWCAKQFSPYESRRAMVVFNIVVPDKVTYRKHYKLYISIRFVFYKF